MSNDMFACIGCFVGGLIWAGTIYIAFRLLLEKNIVDSILITIPGFLFGMVFSANGIFNPIKDISYTYEQPTYIMKTNGITVVSYIVGDKVAIIDYSSLASYWISTNIAIKVKHGIGFYGNEVGERYEIVLRTE